MTYNDYIADVHARSRNGKLDTPPGGVGSLIAAAYAQHDEYLINHESCLYLIAWLLYDLNRANEKIEAMQEDAAGDDI